MRSKSRLRSKRRPARVGRAEPGEDIPGSDAPLKYLSISTQQMPEICEYPDSGKFLAKSADSAGEHFRAIHALGESADYWEGEP